MRLAAEKELARSIDDVSESEIVIAGAGVAGLMAALSAAPRRVTLLAKGAPGEGTASGWAQGGVAAAVGEDDSPQLHAADTIAAGAGLCDRKAVGLLVREGPRRIAQLAALGTRFDSLNGRYLLGREAAHSRRRILHWGDATGAELVRALAEAARQAPHITVVEAVAEELVTPSPIFSRGERVHVDGSQRGKWERGQGGDGPVVGIIARAADGRRSLHIAPAIVLATGGIGRVFSHTTNPPSATGDGLAMAARAGAELVDLEMVQFHPTALDVGADPMPLLTEALRGEGATLVDENGFRFMIDEHPLAELAPRDVVARAIWRKLQEGGQTFLDARLIKDLPKRFPTVFELCRRFQLDPQINLLPVAPAAHYHMGGVATDLFGCTTLKGLWACGEVASTGVHGANRLASNSLLEAVVFGARVGESLQSLEGRPDRDEALRAAQSLDTIPGAVDPKVEAEVRDIMWREVGLIRDRAGLQSASERLSELYSSSSLVAVARLITHAAIQREESRGAHYRADFPKRRAEFRKRLHLTLHDLPAPAPAKVTPNS